MADLTKEEVVALGHAVGLEIQDRARSIPQVWRTSRLYPLSCLRNEGIVPGPLGPLFPR